MLLPLPASAQQGNQAGLITALKPRDFLTRGQQAPQEAQKGDPVLWQDIIQTERGGRVRIGLADGSILNIGSEAQVQIVRHDAATQQSEILLNFGKMRALVQKLGRPDSKFEVRTETAVAGVLGTDEYIDASNPARTCATSLAGIVTLRSDDPAIPGVEHLFPGETSCVEEGKPPEPKRLATSGEFQDALESTSLTPDISLVPAMASQGSVLEAQITGENLLPIESLRVSGEGVSVEVLQGATPTRIPLRITVAVEAAPEPRTLTLKTPRGEASVEFVVTPRPSFALELAPPASPENPLTVAPGGQSPSIQIGLLPLGGFGGAAELTLIGLPEGVTPILSAPAVAGGQPVELAFAAAATAPPGDFEITLQGAVGDLVAIATVYLQISEIRLEQIQIQVERFYNPNESPETVTGTNVQVFQGELVRLSASGQNLAWQVANTSLQATGPVFEIDTWQLAPGTYRILVKGTAGGRLTSPQDYTLMVLPLPNPDDVLHGLRQAYETLQVNQYLSYFDPVLYRAYPVLEERVRDSFLALTEARVYLRIDNRLALRDEAIYQAAFEVEFRSRNHPELSQRRQESLTLRLLLLRSRNLTVWKIADSGVTVSEDPANIVDSGTGSGGGITGGTAILELTADASTDPSSPTPLPQGSSLPISIVAASSTLTGFVDLEAIVLGGVTDVTLALSNRQVAINSSLTATVTASSTAALGVVEIEITARAASASASATLNIFVEVVPPVPAAILELTTDASTDPSFPLLLPRSSSRAISIGARSSTLTGFVDLQAIALGDVSIALSSPRVAINSSIPATVTASPTAALGLVEIVISGRAGSASATLRIFVEVVGAGPRLLLIKRAGNALDGETLSVQAGTSIVYFYDVFNEGSVDLTNIRVADDKLGSIGTVPLLRPGESTGLDATALTSANVTNVATATGTPANGAPDVSDSDDAVVVVGGASPAVAVIKTVGNASDGDPLTVPAGTSVSYFYLPINIGNTELINIQVTDDKLGLIGTVPLLRPGESEFFSAVTSISANVTNVATVTATPAVAGAPLGLPDVSDTDDAVVVIGSPAPSVQLSKVAAGAPDGAVLTVVAGSSVDYIYEVKNTGNTELINAVVTDDRLGSIGTTAPVRPGESEFLSTLVTITASVTNLATVTATPAAGGVSLGLANVTDTDDAVVVVSGAVVSGSVIRKPTTRGRHPAGPQPSGEGALPELAVRAAEVRQEPHRIRPGEPVQFRVPVHNRGGGAARDVVVEFALPELGLRQRETLDLGPGETVVVVFAVGFSFEDSRHPLRPQVTLDPAGLIPEPRRDNNLAILPPLQPEAGPHPLTGRGQLRPQRARLVVAPGDCVGFRFGGNQTACGGAADIELLIAPDGFTPVLEAAGLEVVNATSFEEFDPLPAHFSGTQAALETGRMLVVQPRSGAPVVVRIRAIRRSSAVQAPRTGRPGEVDGPRIRRSPGEGSDLPRGTVSSGVLPRVQVEFEWVGLR